MTKAELERLALLLEELGEAEQAIGKILRHGYENWNPLEDNKVSNRATLERELGHVQYAVDLLIKADDISRFKLLYSAGEKSKTIGRWLHHQAHGEEK